MTEFTVVDALRAAIAETVRQHTEGTTLGEMAVGDILVTDEGDAHRIEEVHKRGYADNVRDIEGKLQPLGPSGPRGEPVPFRGATKDRVRRLR